MGQTPDQVNGARIDELRRLLSSANVAYYVQAEPIMSDLAYDELLQELIVLESRYPSAITPDSPSQRVGGTPIEGFETVEHAVAMQSIENTYNIEEVSAWLDRVQRGVGEGVEVPLVTDPKIDGVALSLRYEDGLLVQAVTRGDGRKGDDVTAQAKAIRAIPLRLQGEKTPVVLEVRGEAFLPIAAFERLNAARERSNEPLYANARNVTAGTLKSLDPDVVARRGLQFIAHGLGEVRGWEEITGYTAFCAAIRRLGIPVNGWTTEASSLADVTAQIEALAVGRPDLGYGIDGIVIRVDRFDQQTALGSTAKAPRWCIAYKYPAQQGRTVLREVQWQVGKGGTLTPRATMDPIALAGTTVQHATMHNIDEITRKDIRLGDTVVVEKAGEIIPQIVEVVEALRPTGTSPIEAPKVCPVCGGGVEAEGPKRFCLNRECPGQMRERLAWFAGRDQMDIDGLGEKLVDQLVDAGLVTHFADLFTLTVEELVELEGVAEKSATSLVDAIAQSRDRGLSRVLAAVGIPQVGRVMARTLARAYPSITELMAASHEELMALPDVGDRTAQLLLETFRSKHGGAVFQRLGEVGVTLASDLWGVSDDSHSPVSGKTVVITGSIPGWTRTALAARLEELGATVTGSVSARTDLLVAGEKGGAKREKAVGLGIEIWDGERILAVVED